MPSTQLFPHSNTGSASGGTVSGAGVIATRTGAPLADPDRVFSGLPGVNGWSLKGQSGYVLTVSDPALAAPRVTRALVAAGADVLAISESYHSLEDVYLQLINQEVEADPKSA